MKELIRMPKSKFLKVVCPKCKNKQIVISKASTYVRCTVCNAELVNPKGGNAHIKGKIIAVFG
ncbi:30S ribosomal protein S27e [Thermococci archaeon]|nr:MAG: 30S ribosomal protein S27e [Thermococci archaeon]